MSQLYKKVELSIFDNQSTALQLLGIMDSSKSKILRKKLPKFSIQRQTKIHFLLFCEGTLEFFLVIQVHSLLSKQNSVPLLFFSESTKSTKSTKNTFLYHPLNIDAPNNLFYRNENYINMNTCLKLQVFRVSGYLSILS